MPQYFIEQDIVENETISISGDDAHHIINVLRLTTGDKLVISDGKGNKFLTKIETTSKNNLTVFVTQKIISQNKESSVTVALSLIAKDRFEWCIEKLVELGVVNIIPIISNRSVIKLKDSELAKKLDRWNKIALSAARQSGLPFIPRVHNLEKFDSLISNKNYDEKIFFYEWENSTDISTYAKTRKRVDSSLIIIGPEGGFEDHEVKLAKTNECKILSLGSQILRVETAAIAATTIWLYICGEMNIT